MTGEGSCDGSKCSGLAAVFIANAQETSQQNDRNHPLQTPTRHHEK